MENYDRQQIGGYFSQTNASKDEALKGIVAARISLASDIADSMYTATSNLVRIATMEGCRISLYKEELKSRSMLLPQGTVEYFSVTPGDIIYVDGSANISSIE